jgi:antitoxin (DNA-binding transcriptional repressor) of toxin-antitoxin stability system
MRRQACRPSGGTTSVVPQWTSPRPGTPCGTSLRMESAPPFPDDSTLDSSATRLHFCATMKTATVRDLRNRYTSVLRWISAGEEVLITQRGKVIARLTPETDQTAGVVDWSASPEVVRDRSGETVLSAEQSANLLAEAGGRW